MDFAWIVWVESNGLKSTVGFWSHISKNMVPSWSVFGCVCAFCKPFMHLAVIPVDWKARRCTWSLRTSFTTRSNQLAVQPQPASRTVPAAQGNQPAAQARQKRGRQTMEVSDQKHGEAVLMKVPEEPYKSKEVFLFDCPQIGAKTNLRGPQSQWTKPTVQRPKWSPAMGTVLSTGRNLKSFCDPNRYQIGKDCQTFCDCKYPHHLFSDVTIEKKHCPYNIWLNMPNFFFCFEAPKPLKTGTTKRRAERKRKKKRKRRRAALLRQKQRTVARSREMRGQGRRSEQHVRVRRRPPRQTGRNWRPRRRATKTTRPKLVTGSQWSHPGSAMPSRSPRARRRETGALWQGPSSHRYPEQSQLNWRGVRSLCGFCFMAFSDTFCMRNKILIFSLHHFMSLSSGFKFMGWHEFLFRCHTLHYLTRVSLFMSRSQTTKARQPLFSVPLLVC